MTEATQQQSSTTTISSKLNFLRSSLQSKVSSIESLTPDERRVLLDQSRQYKSLWEATKIERAFETSSPKQVDLANDFWKRGHDVYAAVGGNRSGKTICIGWLCFARYLRDKAQPNDFFWTVSPSFDKSVTGPQKELWSALPKAMFGNQVWEPKNGFGQRRTILITLPCGGTCVVKFKSADQEGAAFESDKLVGVWIDETIEETLYDRILARLVDLNGFCLISTIPDASWMNRKLKRAKTDAKVYWQQFCMADNSDNLPPGAIDRARAQWSEEEARMRIDGEFRFLRGVVYKEFIEAHKPDGHLVKPFKIPASWPKWRAMDVGRAHPTAMLWATVSPNDTMYIYREYYQRFTPIIKDAAQIKLMSKGEEYQGKVIIDPSAFYLTKANPISVGQQFAQEGIECCPARRTQEFGEQAGVEMIRRKLEWRQLFIFDTCKNLIDEFGSWSYKMDKDDQPLDSDAYEDKNNDALDALRYLITSDLRFKPHEVEWSSLSA